MGDVIHRPKGSGYGNLDGTIIVEATKGSGNEWGTSNYKLDDYPNSVSGISSEKFNNKYGTRIAVVPSIVTGGDSDVFRVAIFNVYLAFNSSTAERNACIEHIERVDADVLCLNEITAGDISATVFETYLPQYPYYQVGDHASNSYAPCILSKFPIINSGRVYSPVGSNEYPREPVWVEIDVGGERNLLIYNVHMEPYCKVAPCDETIRPTLEFSRAIEFIRIQNHINARRTNQEVLIVGDYNEDPAHTQTAQWTSRQQGATAGSDITYPLKYAQHPIPALEKLNMSLVDATDTDGGRDTVWTGDPNAVVIVPFAIDHLARTSGIDVIGSEILSSEVADQSIGLTKYGDPLPSGGSQDASDHKLVFADFQIPAWELNNEVLSEAGSFAAGSSIGYQTVPLSSGIWNNKRPKVVFLWSAALGTPDTPADQATLCFGSAINSTYRATIGVQSDNSGAVANTFRRDSGRACITRLLPNGTLGFEADFIAFGDDNSFTVNWSVAPNGHKIHYLCLGGDGVENVSIDRVESPDAIGTQTTTGLGFSPSTILTFSAGFVTGEPATVADSHMSIGAATSIDERSTVFASEDGADPMNAMMRQNSTSVISILDPSTNTNSIEATLDSFDEDGFTLNFESTTSGVPIWVVGIKGPQSKLIDGTEPVTNTSVEREIGFAPKSALVLTGMAASSTGVQAVGHIGVGCWDSENNQAFAGIADEPGTTTSDTDRTQSETKSIVHLDYLKNEVGQCIMAGSGNSLIETWTDTDGTAREHWMLVFGDKV